MNHGACPAPNELCQFLDEQLEPNRQAEIGTHIDLCLSCQTALETLTRRRVSDLFGLSTDFLDGGPGRLASDQDQIDEAEGIDGRGAKENGRRCADTDRGVGSQVGDQSSHDPDRTRSYVSPGASSTDAGPPPSGESAGHSVDADQTETDFRRRLPQVPGYDLIELLGEGGMGVVYRARQHGLNRLVAVKMVRADRRGSAERLARFRIEAEAIARLHDPNIVQIFEIGEVDGTPFVSLELLEGGSLDDKLASTTQPGRPAAELVITLARAVQVAHDAGVIHRDLKPSNIMFTRDGTPKITDFGLAKLRESDSRQTETGQIMGSPSYMAPEQARGETRNVGPPADVYALGAILYEMLTGRPPFKGETPVETLRQVTDDEVVPPSRLVPKVARDLETICLHCLDKDQSRRYGSAMALAEDLENFLAGRPIKARRTPLWERGWKLARRHPVAAMLVTLGLIGGTLATGLRLEYSARQARRVASLRSAATQSLFDTQSLVATQEWSDAELRLTAILPEIRGEPALADLALRAADLLKRAEQGRSAAKMNEEAKQRLATFRQRHHDALVHETHFAGLGLPHDPTTVVSSAQAALAVFTKPGDGKAAELGRLVEGLTPDEKAEINEGCFEMLLLLADAEPSAERRLGLLDQAGRLGPPTRAYLLRRAECLDRLGDARAARDERKRAEALTVESPMDHYLQGKALYHQKEWSKALSQLRAALLRRPDHFWAHGLSAICNLQLHRPFQAQTDLTACLQSGEKLPWLYELRGFAAYQIATMVRSTGESLRASGETYLPEAELQLQAAEDDYNRALELLGSVANKELRYSLLVNRGLLWLERREWQKAVAELQQAIQLDSRNWQAFETLAQVFQHQGRPEKAIEQFNRAIDLQPRSAPLYRARAEVNRVRRDQSSAHRVQAIADLEQAIRLEPPGTAVVALDQAHRARLLLEEARFEDALAASEAAIGIDRDHLEAHLVRVEALRNLNRYDDVVRSCDSLLARGKPSAELYQLRGLAREKTKNYPAAIEDFTLAIGLKPGSAEIRSQRGALYLATDAPRAALRDFEAAIRLDSSDADAYMGRGLALVALGQHREGAADAAKALKMSEPTVKRLYGAARIYAQAAYAVGAEARKNGQDAVSLFTRYQDEAMNLLREWLKRIPAAERAASLRDLQEDPAMAILRRRLRALEVGVNVHPARVGSEPPPVTPPYQGGEGARSQASVRSEPPPLAPPYQGGESARAFGGGGVLSDAQPASPPLDKGGPGGVSTPGQTTHASATNIPNPGAPS